MIKKCVICEGEGKYKCPKCETYNCSLTCFKSHKTDGKCDEIHLVLTSKAREEIIEDKTPTRTNVFTTIDTVPSQLLEKLPESQEILNLLQNPHLRHFLQEIDKASNPWNAMKLAMAEPIFVEFANECLKVVENKEIIEE